MDRGSLTPKYDIFGESLDFIMTDIYASTTITTATTPMRDIDKVACKVLKFVVVDAYFV